jgi:hypothetical protein
MLASSDWTDGSLASTSKGTSTSSRIAGAAVWKTGPMKTVTLLRTEMLESLVAVAVIVCGPDAPPTVTVAVKLAMV